jgi:CheY-like chemotaxis protein
LRECIHGLASTAAIRRHEQSSTSHVPIIAVTADAIEGDNERFLAAGMDGYISKPIERAKLLDTITSAVRASRQAAVPAPCDDGP